MLLDCYITQSYSECLLIMFSKYTLLSITIRLFNFTLSYKHIIYIANVVRKGR